jgi:hypothetical protein
VPLSRRLASFVSPKRIMWRREKTKDHGMRLLACVFFILNNRKLIKYAGEAGTRHLGLIKGGVTPSKKGAESNEITLARYLAVFAHSIANIFVHLTNIYRGYSRFEMLGGSVLGAGLII